MQEENKKTPNLVEKKEIILNIIKREGPCLPSAVSSKVGLSLLIASALLSEMKAEKKLKVSHLKIGGSPLYYVEGQQQKLENFIKHLPKKEQETFQLLKKHEIVDEEKVEPGHRVALKAIKDFAFPIHVKTGDKEKIFWRLHTIKPEDASQRISEQLKPKPEVKKEVKEIKKEEKKIEKKEPPTKKSRISKSKKAKEQFKEKVLNWVHSKNLKIEEQFEEPKFGEDALCIISNNSSLGKLNFLVVAKQKKRLNDADISLAYQQGQQAKMPVLLLTEGKLTKKAQTYLEQLGKFVVVNSLN